MADKELAMCARTLARALMRWARDREEGQRKEIAIIQTDLVRYYNLELQQIKEEELRATMQQQAKLTEQEQIDQANAMRPQQPPHQEQSDE